MKIGLIILALLLSLYANELLAAQKANAIITQKKSNQNKSSKSASKNLQKGNSQLTTDAQFGDHVVGGQYQAPFETVSTVENEKNIDSLIGVRKNFNDRIEKSKSYQELK